MKSARAEYEKCKQGEFESIMDFKRKFETRLKIYTSSGNAAMETEDIAIDSCMRWMITDMRISRQKS